MKKIKVGIIGCGTIGSEIARACQTRLKDYIDLFAICDLDRKKADELKGSLKRKVAILELDGLIKKSDLVVEAASAAISAKVVKKCIEKRKNCLVMSVGGLIGNEKLLRSANEKKINIYLPSGAICGIDGLKSSSVGKIDSVTLTTRKPPKGLQGAPYLKNNNIDLSSVVGEAVIFDGTAEEAIKGFPQNVNVAAALSLAGIGAKRTRVRVVTSPEYSGNTHEIEITGEAGRIMTRCENVPSRTNPKTSALAIFSAIATLEGIVNSVRIGT